jgi:hypothetical protein
MKLCTCRTCNRVFAVTKVKPFCSGVCRRQYEQNDNHPEKSTQANLVGANNDQTCNNQEQV